MEFEANLIYSDEVEDILVEVNTTMERAVAETAETKYTDRTREENRRYSIKDRLKLMSSKKLLETEKTKRRWAEKFSRKKKEPESAWKLKAEIQQIERSKCDQGKLSNAQCRLCFMYFYSKEERIVLSYGDAKTFKDLTGLKLSLNKMYPREMCTGCNQNLKKFVMLRRELIRDQKNFYSLVGFYAQDPERQAERDSFSSYASPEKEIDIKEEQRELFVIEQNQLIDIKEEKDELAIVTIETKTETLENVDVNLSIPNTFSESNDVKKLNLRPRVKNVKSENNFKKVKRLKVPVRCPHCSEMVTGLATHRRNLHKLRNWKYSCDMCNFSSTKHRTMTEHMKMEIDRGAGIGKSSTKSIPKSKCKTELCNHCGKFITNLKEHLYTIVRDHKFFCDLCNFTTHRKCFLQGHLMRRHMPSVIIPCDQCHLKFRFQKDLQRHKVNSHGPRNMKCNLCTGTYRSAEMLRKHKDKFHKNNRIFKCDMCEMVLSSEGSLRYHRNRHLNKREYKCPKCLNAFCTPNQFARHPCNALNFTCEAPGCSAVHSRIDHFRIHVKKHPDIPDVVEAMLSKAKKKQENHVGVRYIREKL